MNMSFINSWHRILPIVRKSNSLSANPIIPSMKFSECGCGSITVTVSASSAVLAVFLCQFYARSVSSISSKRQTSMCADISTRFRHIPMSFSTDRWSVQMVTPCRWGCHSNRHGRHSSCSIQNMADPWFVQSLLTEKWRNRQLSVIPKKRIPSVNWGFFLLNFLQVTQSFECQSFTIVILMSFRTE